MSTLSLPAVLLGLAAPAALAAPVDAPAPAAPEADWSAFSDNLVAALASGNDGLRTSALQLLIHHVEREWREVAEEHAALLNLVVWMEQEGIADRLDKADVPALEALRRRYEAPTP